MAPNPLPSPISPLQGRSFLSQRSLPIMNTTAKSSSSSASATNDTLHSLLIRRPTDAVPTPSSPSPHRNDDDKNQQQPHKTVVSSSDVSDIATEALRIAQRRSSSLSHPVILTELLPNGGKLMHFTSSVKEKLLNWTWPD